MALPGSAGSMPCSKVALQVSCSNLTNKDVASKSDPCAVLSMQDRYGNWYEAGRTENVKNCLNPEFVHTFEIDYYFEEVQQLFFAVYDIDNKTEKLTDDDFLGQIQCTLAQVVASSPYVRPLVKKDGKNAGKGEIKVRAEEIGNLNDSLRLSFKAQKLDKKDLLSKSDPYLEFSRQTADGVWLKVHRTEVINNNLNPQWKPFDVKVQKLCAGNYDVLIKVDCYDYDDDGSHDFIGTFTAPCKEFLAAVDRQVEWPCINAKKQAKKSSYKNSGVIILTSCQVRKDYSFLDYVFGGMQINFTVAIDFTASNGEPNTPQSLHYINPAVSNDYQKAILAVGGVIQDYDSDKMFPALGFGAKVPPNMTVSHEFPLNFNPTNPFCAGIEGVLAAYQSCIQSVVLWGPTNFAPVIYHVAQFALAAAKEGAAKSYFVLLIITDGEITDMDNTCAAIVYASKLPMSIIIVGVGPANFSAMSTLDGDDGALKSPSGEPVARDIVQFVPFREVQQQSGAALARHVLAEVPQQLCAYCKAMSIVPGGGVQQ